MGKILEGKNVLITGARKGIGKAILELFAEEGANIWAHARELTPEFQQQCEETGRRNGVVIEPLCFDLRDPQAMKGAVKRIMSSKKSVDALINNAGIIYNALFQMSSMNEVREQMEVNFFAPYLMTQYIVKLMLRNKKGSIVNLASIVALDGNSGKSAYGASKAALIAMSKSIAEELGPSGIRVNCIAPGITNTQMLEAMPEYAVKDSVKASALGTANEPIDIAKTAAFLASDLSSYITGQVIRVDGGVA